MFTNIKLYIAGVAAALFGLLQLAFYLLGRRDGADAVEHEIMEDRLEAVQEARRVEHEVDDLDDTELSERARSWVRGNDG